MTTENATPPGAFESASSARSQAMADIAKRVHDENAGDLNSFDEDSGQIGAKLNAGTTEVKPEPAAQEPQATEDQPEAPEVQASDDGLETIVIDGQEQRVKREQVIDAGRRTLQKEAAADRRLEEAAETLRRAKAYEQGIMQRQPSSDAGGQQQPSSDAANGSGGTSRQAIPDIGTLVDERLWLHDATKAAQRFQEEFDDIAKDPLAARLVAQLEDERLAKAASTGSPLGDPWEAYKAHGEQVRNWLGRAKPKEVVQVSTDRTERKRETVTVTGSTTRQPQPSAPKPLTVPEQVEKMRQQRQQGRQIQPAR